MKIYRNVKLKGIISKESAYSFYFRVSQFKPSYTLYRGRYITVNRDDMGDLWVDIFDTDAMEPEGGEFDLLGEIK